MRKQRHRKREIEQSIDDGVIEKPDTVEVEFANGSRIKFKTSATTSGRFQSIHPNVSAAPVNSNFREGMSVSCPDKSKLGKGALTVGTIFQLFGSECLVLGHDGLIHRCFISELS